MNALSIAVVFALAIVVAYYHGRSQRRAGWQAAKLNAFYEAESRRADEAKEAEALARDGKRYQFIDARGKGVAFEVAAFQFGLRLADAEQYERERVKGRDNRHLDMIKRTVNES